MNIKTLHLPENAVSAVQLFKGTTGISSALQLRKHSELKKHISKVPALLLCIDGVVIFDNEKNYKTELRQGDFVLIEENVTHWLVALEESQLLLIK